MTADESLWRKQRDTRTEARVDLAGGDVRRDAPLADGRDGLGRDRSGDRGVGVDAVVDVPKLVDMPKLVDVPKLVDKPKPDASCGQMQLDVTAPGDDGEMDHGYFAPDGEPGGTIYMGFWDGKSVWGYFRFALTKAIPQGAKITGATLSLYGIAVDGTWDPASHALTVWAEASADAPAAGSAADTPFEPGGRALTASSARWPTSGGLSWILNGTNLSPSLVPVLQEIVNQHSLAAGNHVQLWVRGAQTVDAECGTADYKHPSFASHPHRLTISWCQ